MLALLAVPLQGQSPYLQPDDTWISIDGTVSSVMADQFTLDYGDGMVIVEMDDGDRDADAYVLTQGDEVTVNGMVDDDFRELATIEASSVYVDAIDTYFYASAADEEDLFVAPPVVDAGTATLQGTVTAVMDDEFILSDGASAIRVETEEMSYDPLDRVGYQRIETGDRVSVAGHIDVDLFEGGEFVAEAIVELID